MTGTKSSGTRMRAEKCRGSRTGTGPAGVIILVAALVAIGMLVVMGVGDGKTIVIDDDGGRWADYTSIDDALDDAKEGDHLLVYDGIYDEPISIRVSVTITGNGTNSKVWTKPDEIVIQIYASGCLLQRINVKGKEGIIFHGNNNRVVGVRMEANGKDRSCAISFHDSRNTSLENSTIIHNAQFITTVELDESFECKVLNNVIFNGGIGLDESNDCVIFNNTIYDGPISLERSIGCRIDNNSIYRDNIIMTYSHWTQNATILSMRIGRNNTVDDKPILFLKDMVGIEPQDDFSQLISVNCSKLRLTSRTLTSGLIFLLSNMFSISDNIFSSSLYPL
ncbi:MAG: hypothetical protein L0213_00910, partial [Candidatus Dadabacteria bacterium]|nr:hypothetical protein [Candidatus Dadabacteria bacterium]